MRLKEQTSSHPLPRKELGVTHGAISRQVQALEHWLGLKLFRRFDRRLDIAIRCGPGRYRDHASGSFLKESGLPVCSPELLKPEPLP
jgi:DNA-binding transcriptional LysR family regulator